MNIAVFAIDYNPPWDEGTKKIEIIRRSSTERGKKKCFIAN